MRKLAENAIQQECLMDFNNRYCLERHEPRLLIYSVPNESENAYETQKKVNTGLLKGVSDTVVLMPGGASLYMECKTDIGYQSAAQKKFQERVEKLGFTYGVFRSLKQFYDILNPHLTKAGLEAYNG